VPGKLRTNLGVLTDEKYIEGILELPGKKKLHSKDGKHLGVMKMESRT